MQHAHGQYRANMPMHRKSVDPIGFISVSVGVSLFHPFTNIYPLYFFGEECRKKKRISRAIPTLTASRSLSGSGSQVNYSANHWVLLQCGIWPLWLLYVLGGCRRMLPLQRPYAALLTMTCWKTCATMWIGLGRSWIRYHLPYTSCSKYRKCSLSCW